MTCTVHIMHVHMYIYWYMYILTCTVHVLLRVSALPVDGSLASADRHMILEPLRFVGTVRRSLSSWCTAIPAVDVRAGLEDVEVDLSVCLPICLFVCLSICLSVCLSAGECETMCIYTCKTQSSQIVLVLLRLCWFCSDCAGA